MMAALMQGSHATFTDDRRQSGVDLLTQGGHDGGNFNDCRATPDTALQTSRRVKVV